MQKVFLLFLIAILNFGCEVAEEVYLYDEDSAEYDDLLELEQVICKANAIFTAMNDSKAFLDYGYDVNSYYMIEGKKDGDKTHESYLKITSVSNTVLVYQHHCNSGCSTVDTQVTVTQTMMDDFITAIQDGVCALNNDLRYTSSGLSSSTSMTFSDFREDETLDDDDEVIEYTRKTDSFRANLTYPLPFVLYNFARTINSKEEDETAETDSYSYTITEIDSDECDDDSDCDFSGTFTDIDPTIDTDAYASDAIGSVPFSISNFPTP